MYGSLIPSKAPSLPPPAVASFTNVLTLYFNQLDSINRSILGPYGGRFIACPVGLFFNTASQTLAAANTAYPVVYNSNYFFDGVSLSSSSRLVANYAGIYNFQYSGQVESTNASAKDVFIWLRRSGTNIGYSTRAYTLSGSGTKLAIAWDFDIDLDVNEYIEIIWAATDTAVTLTATAATSPHPGIPSSVISVNFVAPLPDPRPTPP